MEDNIQLPQKSHGLPTMQAAQPTATVCNPVLPPAAAIQQIQVQAGNGPIRTPQTSNPFLPTSSMANMSRGNLPSDTNTQRNSANFPQLSQPEVMPTVNSLNHSITRPHPQMNFHDGSKSGSFANTPSDCSPSILRPTVPAYLPRHMVNQFSTPNTSNVTPNALDGSTYY